MDRNERSAYIFLSLLQARVGGSLASRLATLSPGSLLEMPTADLARQMGMRGRASRAFGELRQGFDPEALHARLSGRGIGVLTPVDAGYPELLKETPDPPPALFVEGKIPEGAAVALVGSRRASATGLEAARVLGRALGGRGVCVVSGLALGVDAAAHEGALEASGPTVGVLGCGIDVVYPRSNGDLFNRVKKNGAIVSEYYLGEAPLAWRFPARNRIIAGLCDAVVVVEAPQKSGALITAHHALECGRDVWAAPGSLMAPECKGSNRLLAEGANVLWDVQEFVEAYVSEVSETPVERGPVGAPPELPEAEAAVLAAIGYEPTGADALAARCGVEMRTLLATLATLELKGYVSRNPGGAFVRKVTP